jgi:hypothetical protein
LHHASVGTSFPCRTGGERNHSGAPHTTIPNTLRFCRQIIHTTSAEELQNCRGQSVQHTVRISCCRSMWGPRWEGITKDSPEHGRTVLVDIYRLQYCGVLWVAPNGSEWRKGDQYFSALSSCTHSEMNQSFESACNAIICPHSSCRYARSEKAEVSVRHPRVSHELRSMECQLAMSFTHA